MSIRRFVGLSVDVEEWFHGLTSTSREPGSWSAWPSRVDEATDRVLDLFADAKVHATFFILGLVCQEHPKVVSKIAAAGHEIACHGFDHRLVTGLKPACFEDDCRRAKDILEETSGQPVVGYRAPAFSLNHDMTWALDTLLRVGFVYDASLMPFRTPLGGERAVPGRQTYRTGSGTLTRFPVATANLGRLRWPVGGGFFVRVTPLRLLPALLSAVPEGSCFYLHPWEIDDPHPVVFANAREHLSHYAGLRSAPRKWRLILGIRELCFRPLREFLG